MKKVILTILAVVVLNCTAFAAECFNAQGSAVVPGLHARYRDSGSFLMENIYLTNITASNVTCKATVYDHDGNDVTAHSQIYTGSNTDDMVLLDSGTGTFSLPPRSTRKFTFITQGVHINVCGYAVIEWKSEDTQARKALIGLVRSYSKNEGMSNAAKFLINNGQPF